MLTRTDIEIAFRAQELKNVREKMDYASYDAARRRYRHVLRMTPAADIKPGQVIEYDGTPEGLDAVRQRMAEAQHDETVRILAPAAGHAPYQINRIGAAR